jgi:hypothetical protein
MICTAPLFYEEHEEPYDFFRYTQFAWRHLIREAGLTLERLDWMEGYMGTVAYQLETSAKYLPYKPHLVSSGWKGWVLSPLLMVIKVGFRNLAKLFYILDEQKRFVEAGFPKNYVAIVSKAN